MDKAWMGKLITGGIVMGMAAILLANLAPGRPSPSSSTRPEVKADKPAPPDPAGDVAAAREHPIGDGVVENHMSIAAVWLSAVQMEGMSSTLGSGQTPIHIEADVKATENNPQGFGLGLPVPYLKLTYRIVPAAGGPTIDRGDLGPMMARDGFHYGATVAMPAPGDYKLVYRLEPGTSLGLHRDPATGVAPWWAPFEVTFDWKVEAEPATGQVAGTP